MSDNNTSSSADAANPTSDTRRGVEIHQAEAVEIHYDPDGRPIDVTVKGWPGAVNFIAKTTDPNITIAVSQGDAFRKVMTDQFAYHMKRSGGNPRGTTTIRTVPLEAAVADGQAAVNNTRA